MLPPPTALALAHPTMISVLGLATPLRLRGSSQAPRAPLYWDAYEYNIRVDGNIPEREWAANVDWVEKNLKPYGFRMVAIDGWGDEVYSADGYRAAHAREWKHDYAWWSKNLRARGMELGVYTNPLWIVKAAADAGVKVKGTDFSIESIRDKRKSFFNWVDVNRPGAEAYVKGYVQYYADMGVRYLRVDFLSWYESGWDRNIKEPVGPTDRPRRDYETALRWMREACAKSGIVLSLVMPNLNREAELESRYGDMIRIDEDAGEGGWSRWSDNARGVRREGWSQWANPVDGLTYWSRLSGRGRLILDPDFLRLNTFATDDEYQSVVSLCLLAGAPVTVADQYSTVGGCLPFYQNREMLALNADGFVGKPLVNDPTREASQTWTGRMSNGDWIVGLFNREPTPRVRSLAFASLGFPKASVRDLWTHRNLGTLTSYRATVPPHGCVVLRLSKAPAPYADAPAFDSSGGTFAAPPTVGLSAPAGSTIRYTLDGTDPTPASPVYRAHLRLEKTALVKAVAQRAGRRDSYPVARYYAVYPPSPLPGGWTTVDVGSQGGSAAFAGGAFTLAGSGTDIEGNADGFRFAYRSLDSDGTITARVASLAAPSGWAKAGLMVRDGLGADAQNVFLAATHEHGVAFQRRIEAGNGTQTALVPNLPAPIWLRLRRTGDSFSAFRSSDGEGWTLVGSATVPMGRSLLVGLAMTSHRDGVLGAARFEGGEIQPGGR